MSADKVGREVDALLRGAEQADRDAAGLARSGERWGSARMAAEAERLRAQADRLAAEYAAEVRR